MFGSDKFSEVLQSIRVFWKRKSWQETDFGVLNLLLSTLELLGEVRLLSIGLLVTCTTIWLENISIKNKYFSCKNFSVEYQTGKVLIFYQFKILNGLHVGGGSRTIDI